MIKILVIDDEEGICKAAQIILSREGYDVLSVSAGAAGIKSIYENDFDVLFVDLKLPDMSGLEIISEAKKRIPSPEVIVITGFASIETAVEAIRRGAYDYLTKPLSPDKLRITVKRAVEKVTLRKEVEHLRNEINHLFELENVVGESVKMKDVFKLVRYCSQSDSSVIVTGDSGTGKELIARAIHYNSKRRENPFIAVNCAAIAKELIESELFGYVKGAFTGALKDKSGILEAAAGGTLFLDEIGETSLDFQVKLLRVLQEGEFNKVGAPVPIKIDIRVVAATNRNLKKAIEDGIFREDLYYRLNVVSIHIPALRQRKEDIPLLSMHFLKKHTQKHPQKKGARFSSAAMEALVKYDYPGNVRELENVVEYALVFLQEQDEITLSELPSHITSAIDNIKPNAQNYSIKPLRIAKYEFERNYIISIMEQYDGNISKAAKALDIHRQNLQQKLKELDINSESIKKGTH
ncbi:two component sigma54 specific Fis family transcriptional regulator [Candidatus Magnetoovum chiemensis]|nr:two component sigma54 specific Fis family transcriptional regulator [Candidatus Magnetoovum chiemensis]